MRNRLLASVVLTASLPAVALAHEEPPAPGEDAAGDAAGAVEDDAAPAATERMGIIPIPEFGGSLADRAYLSGDWNGARAALAEDAGIQLDLRWTQWVHGVVDGGFDTKTVYGGTLDTVLKLDLMRMGVMPGALVEIRGLSRYGDFIAAKAGQVLPVNTNAIIPQTAPIYDDYGLALSGVTYVQFLSEHFGLLLGKIDTFNGDQNEFATGRGQTQFMDYNFVFAAPTAIVPASTLGVGMFLHPNEHLTITSTLLNARNTSSTVGFDEIDGGISATEARFQYRMGDLPGGVNGTFIYFFNADLTELDGKLSFPPGGGLKPAATDETWMVVLSGWQYLHTEQTPGDGPLDLTNGKPDLQGFGLFGRLAFADDDVNPWKFNASIGLGGRGILPNRDDDVFGVGVFYSDLDSDLFVGGTLVDDSEWGMEAFYSLAITPAMHLTFDVQYFDTPIITADDAVTLGLRLRTDF
jgi:porin